MDEQTRSSRDIRVRGAAPAWRRALFRAWLILTCLLALYCGLFASLAVLGYVPFSYIAVPVPLLMIGLVGISLAYLLRISVWRPAGSTKERRSGHASPDR